MQCTPAHILSYIMCIFALSVTFSKSYENEEAGQEIRGCQLSMTTQKVLMTTQIISWVVMMTTQLFFVPLSCSDRARVIMIKSFLVLFVIMYMYIESCNTHPSIMTSFVS